MSEMPEIGGRAPLPIEVEAGKSYWWCACGRSQKQPFCDGSHKVHDFTPIEFKAPKSPRRCGSAPASAPRKSRMCDGTHKTLERLNSGRGRSENFHDSLASVPRLRYFVQQRIDRAP